VQDSRWDAYTPVPVRDKSLYRRKFAYPIVTLVVAGVVFLMSRGQIATTAPAKPGDYESFARDVMFEVRSGKPVPSAISPAIETVFRAVAPASVREPSGGDLFYEVIGPTAPGENLPHIQTVVVRSSNGEGVGIAISILGGRTEVVGVSRVDRSAPREVPAATMSGEGSP
jgi:hypothetical protein